MARFPRKRAEARSGRAAPAGRGRFLRKRSEAPAGAARLAVSYLASVIALAGAALSGVSASPIVDASRLCAVDPTELCRPVILAGVGALAFWGLVALAAWLLGLGLALAGW
ncbi:MAG: hypothetical protein LBI84_09760, partial [Propionibacteriaceae bacterium]|nr:hypothetical protein [Propionibacteriaceae bacterium]